MKTAIISHPDCLLHEMGTGHPESPARLRAVAEHITSAGLERALQFFEAPLATREQLERVHSSRYLDTIDAAAPAAGLKYLDPDTAMNRYSRDAALRAAGAVVLGTDLVMAGKVQSVFCNVRPPGHHAERARAMGFCIFNNIAVGVAHALAHHGIERAAIVDFDVHHGNGTEDIFSGNAKVLMVSTFQHPFYPHSGAATTASNMCNVPLQAGSGSLKFRTAVVDGWLPALDAFKPEFIYISAGFDAHRDDAMAGMKLDEADYAWVTREISKIAGTHAQGRIVSALEGGYALGALGRSAVAHIRALSGTQ